MVLTAQLHLQKQAQIQQQMQQNIKLSNSNPTTQQQVNRVQMTGRCLPTSNKKFRIECTELFVIFSATAKWQQ